MHPTFEQLSLKDKSMQATIYRKLLYVVYVVLLYNMHIGRRLQIFLPKADLCALRRGWFSIPERVVKGSARLFMTRYQYTKPCININQTALSSFSLNAGSLGPVSFQARIF